MGYLKELLIICFLGIHFCIAKSKFSEYDISFVQVMHWSHCTQSAFCDNSTDIVFPPPILNPFPPTGNDGTCCKSCSCDLDLCTLSGTCCPDLFDFLPNVEESTSRIKVVCQSASLRKKAALPKGLHVWMFIKCPDGYTENETKEKCESPDIYSAWDAKIPVVRQNRSDMPYYQNIHCALCHNVSRSEVKNWEVYVQCSEGELIPSSLDTLIDEVKNSDFCNIVYNYPLNDDAMKTCEVVTSECNVTGLWQEYDALTEAACHAYTDIYDGKYQNIFCFLCNEPKPYTLPARCTYSDSGPVWPTFSALLKFTAPSDSQEVTNDVLMTKQIEGKCEETQIFDDYKNTCRDLFCLPPKALIGGNCVDNVEYLTGVAYEAFINLVPNDTLTVADALSIASEVWEIYHNILQELGGYDPIYELNMYYNLIAGKDSLIQNFILHCIVHFTYPNMKGRSNIFVNGLLTLQNEEFTSKSNRLFKLVLGFYDSEVSIYHSPIPVGVTDRKGKWLVRINNIIPPINRTRPVPEPNSKLILITKVLGCPMIKLSTEELSLDDKNRTVDLKAVYPPGSFVSINESGSVSIYVCADDFLLVSSDKQYQKEVQNVFTSTPNGAATPQGIISLMCTCISVLCLILTLITYCLFQELRTQPGINNIALVICLIIAQSLFQFGIDQSDSVPVWGCQTIGVLIHFFWLEVLFWMNVCSIHMFCVFIAIKKLTVNKKSLKQTIIYTTYTSLAAGLLILINIIVSIKREDSEGIGYGGKLCYISDYRMVGYVFVLPIGAIVVLNLAHFIAVIIKMWRMPMVNSETKHTRNFFAIYAKLSTLTGITWLFGFAYFFTGIVSMEYLFIIFNASQGVFLFLAFVCNKRVKDMYRSWIGQKKTWLSELLHTKKTKTDSFTDI